MYWYLLIFPTLTFSLEKEWENLKIIDDISLDHEEDDSIYCKNMFQPTSFLSPGYGILFEHIRTIYQSVRKHYLVVGMKLPTHSDIPTLSDTLANSYFNISLTPFLLSGKFPYQHEVICSYPNEGLEHFQHWSKLAFSMIHSDLPALLPNQAMKMMGKEHLSFSDMDIEGNKVNNWFIRDTSEDGSRSTQDELELKRIHAYFECYGYTLPDYMGVLYTPQTKHTSAPKGS